ncbi:MAG TPA: hypothetical protein ENN90_08355 [Mariniphaga anaerophila]|uniref:Type I restriction modification DNA specificity domain-containing protein n=1 Tax=Mariniphaga anaerophila TaxID=1484053 RepID=A0A831LL98_9BACT|nr:hypothetical protein [Mariniphaga anaerophila]
MSWKKYKFSDFLTRSKIPIDIEDDTEYKRVTIKTKHQGVSVRDIEWGKKIGTKKQFILKAGQFVLSKIDARYGAFGIAPDEVDNAIITGNFWAYDFDFSIINIEWFNQFTNSQEFYDVCERASSGITHRKYLNENFFLNYEIELPDVTEQLAIIEQFKRNKEADILLSNELSHQLDLIKQLRQAFLREAMQGKLTAKWREENPDIEPASELLKMIKAEKEKLVKEGKIKKQKPLLPISEDEIPFEIPENWVWCRLGELLLHTFYGPRFSNDEYVSYGIPTIRTTDMSDNGIIELKDAPNVKIDDNTKLELYKILYNDLLITRTGSIGTMALFKSDYIAIPSAYLIRCRFIKSEMADFLYKVLKTDFSLEYFGLNTKSGTRPNINAVSISNSSIPVPPLPEQQQIVNKLDELMQYCDKLEESIKTSHQQNEMLLQQVLREALEPEKSIN